MRCTYHATSMNAQASSWKREWKDRKSRGGG